VLAAVNSAKSMAKLAVELLYDKAAEGNRAKSDAGAKMAQKAARPCPLPDPISLGGVDFQRELTRHGWIFRSFWRSPI
jgi:hypothetical protein